MIRGAVYRIDLGKATGRAQAGRRRGIVLSDFPATWSTAIIVPTTTQEQRAIFRPKLEIAGQACFALADQIRTFDVEHIVGEPVDYLAPEMLGEIEYAVAKVLSLRITPTY
ncbi:type II toxin-antitoxin system PemK/MazF family toxin [Streptomyces sp. gCLA4]|uniref:type II toxin-antitoxin system PemK/MazF family toxin n=1 Tax=Streptomyces sp. gCLA4 TaxID=1873416 RepID=UPI0015FF74C4|nr:type II toxin-antitoxin system PemK/MazF family toxin [Streptomyces sp. gCLA4]